MVVLAVNFLGVVFTGENVDLVAQGAGIALPIGALALFVAARAWATRQEHEVEMQREQEAEATANE